MRKIIYIIGLFSAFTFTACDEELNLEPFDALDTSTAFNTNSDFNQAMRGVYRSLLDGNYYGGEFYLLPDVISDNLILSSEGRTSYSGYYLFQQNGELAWLGFFNAAYSTILRTNYIIENIDNLEDGEFKNNILGQALAIRSMAHFDLGRVYSTPPQLAGGGDLGMVYVTETNAGAKPARIGVAEYFDLIEADFTRALGLINAENGTGFLNKAAVHGLMARFYLYTGQDQDAISSADNAISAAATSVATFDEFPDVWDDLTEAGVLFKAINTNLDQVRIGVVYNQAGPDGVRDEYVPDFGFFQEFGADDIRSTWFDQGPFAGNTYNHIIKYLERPGSNQAIVDAKILRMGEVFLTKAEAHANLDQDGAALTALDVVRSERYDGFVSGGEAGNALDEAIALERRLELAFEGHRFFDLKRKNLPIERTAAGDEADGGGVVPPSNALTLPANSPLWQMPIPQTELNANENMQPNPSNN
ncbi:RagB/SusD family nutrient uptake outer membrane protein [Marivirga sp.]|uniref:RagB/SusD family nutrient uptake outer membrane protein n=1 Tax=Marivirga sp. TaxID=2018662 RepID=UPI0025D3C7B9|nr:RagB/SusD family nutrient uptake outer membrane protein [Marivirga sp.]